MQKREKILAGLFGGAVVVWLGLPMFENLFLAPLRELQGREASLKQMQQTKFAEQLDLARKTTKLGEWRGRSLPPNPNNAQRLYQEWLTTLCQLSGIEITKMTLDPPRPGGKAYYTIPVKIDAKATLQELATFFQRFHSVDLLHRIDSCSIVSPANEGDPELNVTIITEGVSMTSAQERARLFDQTELAEPLNKSDKQVHVASGKGFPDKPPFLVRVGEEFLNVTGIDGDTWTVQRGVEKTFATAHDTDDPVEHFPVRPRDEAEAATLAMWSQSLFTKPPPPIDYTPRLASSTPPAAIRGQQWTWNPEVTGWNPAFGAKTFELLSAPEKMEIDERRGTLKWNVTEQTELGDHPVQVLVYGSNGKNSGFTPSLTVRVRNPNQPPKLEPVASLKFFIGRESRVPVKATDPEGQPLKFSLTQSPQGMTIDAATGEIRWTPPETMAPAPVEIAVQVQDTDEAPETVSLKIPATLSEDSARFTYLTGRVSRTDGTQEAWLHDRITGKSTVVREGDAVNIADFEMTIEKIHNDHLLVRRFGQLWRLDFEVPLAQMKPVPGSSEQPAEPPASQPGV